MNQFRRSIVLVLVGAGLLLAGACGGPDLPVEPIAVSANPVEQVNRLDSEISAARKEQVNVLAPSSFEKAEEYLVAARKGIESRDEAKEILDTVSVGRAQLRRAKELAELARTDLAEAIKARDFARSAGAATYFEKEYADVEEDFLGLMKAAESGDASWAKREQAGVARTFRDLEIRAIKDRTLGEVRDLIAQAERKDAQKIAPRTLFMVKKSYQEADAFITQNPYEQERILSLAGAALFQARRLHQVMEQSVRMQRLTPEDAALWAEEIIERTATRLGAPDMRDQDVNTQMENVLGSIAAMEKDRQFMMERVKEQQAELAVARKEHQAEVASLQKRIAALEGKSREEQAERERIATERMIAEDRLAAERRNNELYEEIRKSFDAKEAEIYKQGSQFVIRMKAMQFPVGKDIILPDNYALLSKVQRTIRTIGECTVVIEGHTDSTGSEALNEHLSQRRAEAVRSYFIANGTLTHDRITSVGYGSTRPLASNETARGRAINRRIDIIVTPEPLPRL